MPKTDRTVLDVLVEGHALEVASVPVPTAQPQAPAMNQSPAEALQARAGVVFDSLNHQAAADGDLDARAMIWAGASYLYHQQGEDQSIGFLKMIQARLSIAAWLEQLPIAGLPRN